MENIQTSQNKTITRFQIPGMDCSAEEELIRIALANLAISSLQFDLTHRQLVVTHSEDNAVILSQLESLGFGAEVLIETRTHSAGEIHEVQDSSDKNKQEKNALTVLLLLNGIMFFVEVIAGWAAQSAGLLADALDMFADAAVYLVALYAVGRAAQYKLKAVKFAGVIELFLALGAIGRTIYQITSGTNPEPNTMISISLIALIVNVICLRITYMRRHDGAHMKASYIFSANDVIANLGVIVAGILVAWFSSPVPDWIIGLMIGFVVLNGAIRILRFK